MAARVIRPATMSLETVQVSLPGAPRALGRDEMPVPPLVQPRVPVEERERLLQIALHEFERRWQEREAAFAESLRTLEARVAAELRQEITESVTQLRDATEGVLAQRNELLRNTEESLVRLAVAVARRVVGEAVEIEEKMVLEAVRRALKHVSERVQVVVRVNPAELRLVQQHAPEWLERMKQTQTIRIEEDERIRRGGCRVETEAGSVEAELETQLGTLEKALVERAK